MIYILSGDIGTGKSTALLQWIQDRADVFGILSPRNDLNERYFLDVSTKVPFTMEAGVKDENIISVGRYSFLQSAFNKANSIIKKALEKNTKGIILIDEIGKLEMHSEGLYESASLAIKKTMHHKELHLILVVRTSLIDIMIEKYKIMNSIFISKEQLSSSLFAENVTNVTKKDL